MKLMRIGPLGQEKPAVRVDAFSYVDVSDVAEDFNEKFFARDGINELEPIVSERTAAGQTRTFEDQRIGAPFARPHQILCVGLNYHDHALETGQAVPDEPILFTKSPNTLVGPYDDVRIPRRASEVDWEVELGIVIGKQTSYLDSPADAEQAIAGYVLVNDVSEREFQTRRGGQWLKGKSAETFNPAGPWLATPDEFDNINDLNMMLNINNVRRQTGSTSEMIFNVYQIVHYISQFLVLEPGDLINTGTPPGVGMGRDPQIYLAAGDLIELSIDGLGVQRQRVIAPR